MGIPQLNRRPRRDSPARYRVQVLDRMMQVLDVLAEVGLEMGPSDLSTHLNLHKSTVHRLLVVLAGHRLVSKGTVEGKYRLGMKLFELGNRSVAHIELRGQAMPFLHRLAEDTQETAHISVLDGHEMLSVVNVEGPWTLRLRSGVGRRAPLHCTSSGKATLAFLSDRELARVLDGQPLTRYTPRTIVTHAALKRALARVRERGFAVDDEELEEGLRCIGAPIRDHSGHVIGTISISGPAFRLTRERLPSIGSSVLAAAHGLSAAMGYGSSVVKGQPNGMQGHFSHDNGDRSGGRQRGRGEIPAGDRLRSARPPHTRSTPAR